MAMQQVAAEEVVRNDVVRQLLERLDRLERIVQTILVLLVNHMNNSDVKAWEVADYLRFNGYGNMARLIYEAEKMTNF